MLGVELRLAGTQTPAAGAMEVFRAGWFPWVEVIGIVAIIGGHRLRIALMQHGEVGTLCLNAQITCAGG